MDYAGIHVILLDHRARQDRFEPSEGLKQNGSRVSPDSEPQELQEDIKALLSVFKGVHILSTGSACLAKIRQLDSIGRDCNPTFVFLPVTADLKSSTRSGSARSSILYGPASTVPLRISTRELSQQSGDEEIHGLSLLKHIKLEISESHFSQLIVPIALIHVHELEITDTAHSILFAGLSFSGNRKQDSHSPVRRSKCVEPIHAMRCLEAGARDVLASPMAISRIEVLSTHAFRAHIDGKKARPAFLEMKKARKLSWVGVDEEKPYAYLREIMVSTLMGSICKPELEISNADQSQLYTLAPEREEFVANAIGDWAFPAHELSDDELVHAGYLMLQHALSMPELEHWRLSCDNTKYFLLACRSAYNNFVLYHNFRHVVDVLQAVFYFLLQIGTLPPYPSTQEREQQKHRSPIASLLTPFEAFVLLVTAIGHDVGHPGVNNAFLVSLKAPLAQLYNDNSVLEAFHCAAYSQILRRHWTVAYEDGKIRQLLIKSILATDMQLHFKYMTDIGNLQEKLDHNKGTDGWSDKVLEDYRNLACGLLIKCADISNVARPFDIAAKWSDILQLEFARQGEMEQSVGIETTLFGGPPELGNLTKLANSQIGFMNIFASPLFESVADILPPMQFAVDEIRANQQIWKDKIEEGKTKETMRTEVEKYSRDGMRSPRSGSPERLNTTSEQLSHPEGLPASGSTPEGPSSPPMNTSQGTLDAPNARHTNISPTHLGGDSPLHHESSTQFSIWSTHGSAQATVLTAGEGSPKSPSQIKLPSARWMTTSPANGEKEAPSNHVAISTFNTVSNQENQNNSNYPTLLGSGGGHLQRTDKSSESETGFVPHTYSGNFSRPMSHRHSANTSFARSSAPSGTPTVASTFMPTSPTDTQATSLFEGNSDGAADIPEYEDMDRPGSGQNSMLSGSGYSSSGRSPKGTEVKAMSPNSNGHVIGQREIRRKGSRFRFDFWKKRKAGEVSP